MRVGGVTDEVDALTRAEARRHRQIVTAHRAGRASSRCGGCCAILEGRWRAG